jgi:23S rRNA pseudouridine2605 synthase/23S rRNA pseudouridine2604 synthase
VLERLQKILSARGICSRRKAEEYILAGLVKVNGKVIGIGDKADPEADTIEVDGRVLQERAEMLYYVMNKPVGVETTNIEKHQGNQRNQGIQRVQRTDRASSNSSTSSVRDLLPPHLRGKIYPVGRLDKDSSGLLLFTNDGVLAYRLTHPKFDHDKEYEVVLDRPISPSACRKIEEGFMMDGSMTKPLEVEKIGPEKIRIILREGKNRQIRRMCQAIGYTVKDLRRTRIMTLMDSSMAPGTVRALTQAEKNGLLRSVGL